MKRLVSMLSLSIEQLLYSLSNLVLTVGVAYRGGLEGLGQFGIVLAATVIGAGLVRSWVAEPWYLEGSLPARTMAVRLVAVLLLPISTGIAVVVNIDTTSVDALLLITVWCCAFAGQALFDIARTFSLLGKTRRYLLLADATWAIGVGFAVWSASDVVTILLAWSVLAFLSGLMLLVSVFWRRSSGSDGRESAASRRTTASNTVVAFFASASVAQLISLVLPLIDLSTSGTYRLVLSLVFPIRLVNQAVRFGLVGVSRDASTTEDARAISGTALLLAAPMSAVIVGVVLDGRIFSAIGLEAGDVSPAILALVILDRLVITSSLGPNIVARATKQTPLVRDAALVGLVVAVGAISVSLLFSSALGIVASLLLSSAVAGRSLWRLVAERTTPIELLAAQ